MQSSVVSEWVDGYSAVGAIITSRTTTVWSAEAILRTGKARRTNSRSDSSKARADIPLRTLRAFENTNLSVKRSWRAWNGIPMTISRAVGSDWTRYFRAEGTIKARRALSVSDRIVRSLRAVHRLVTGLRGGKVTRVKCIDGSAGMAIHTSWAGDRTSKVKSIVIKSIVGYI